MKIRITKPVVVGPRVGDVFEIDEVYGDGVVDIVVDGETWTFGADYWEEVPENSTNENSTNENITGLAAWTTFCQYHHWTCDKHIKKLFDAMPRAIQEAWCAFAVDLADMQKPPWTPAAIEEEGQPEETDQ